jgi:hypothetical protein
VIERSGENWQVHTADDGLIDQVRAVICTTEGAVWVAGRHQGTAATATFDGTRWQRHSHQGFGEMVHYQSMHEGRDGKLYIGSTAAVNDRSAVRMLDTQSNQLHWQEIFGTIEF